MNLFDRVHHIRAQIESYTALKPTIGIISGTGIQSFSSHLNNAIKIPYAHLRLFPSHMEEGHLGALYLGTFQGHTVILFAGRFHAYQGYHMSDICLPIYIAKTLGCHEIWMSNLSGGLRENMQAGDLIVVSDHINLQMDNPLIGANDLRFGPRFPDMSLIYSEERRYMAGQVFANLKLGYREGIYASFKGPSLETKAEYQFLQRIGADMIGMSTVPESIVASYLGMNVFCISMISNVCAPVKNIQAVNVSEIMALADEKSGMINQIFMDLLNRIN